MQRRTVLTGLAAVATAPLLVAPAFAQGRFRPHAAESIYTPPVAPTADEVTIRIETGAGLILVSLAQKAASITVANFLRYVDTKRLDGLPASFYRGSGVPEVGLIEGGLQNDPKRILPHIAHESTLVTGLRHVAGTISMARGVPGDANCDFFVCMGPSPALDAKAEGEGDIAGYAAFGHVTEGMDVVARIHAMPKTDSARNPTMRGEILAAPVPILHASRV